jgi:ferredoxin--NADP+ reductase
MFFLMSHTSPTVIPLSLVRPTTPMEVTVVENRDLSPNSPFDVRHVVLALGDGPFHYLEGQSIGVHTPGVDAMGKPHRLRLYSVSSAREGDDKRQRTVALCVKRVVVPNAETGIEFRGLASNYLCDLKPGDSVAISGPIGKHFLLPEDVSTPLLMFATGTGIAPFKAFWQHRSYHPRAYSESHLFFGVRTAADVLYQEELEASLNATGGRLHLALNEENTNRDGKPMMVGDRLSEAKTAIWPLLQEGKAVVYMCGIKGMEDTVSAAFGAIATEQGIDWSLMRAELVKEKRWLVDTY